MRNEFAPQRGKEKRKKQTKKKSKQKEKPKLFSRFFPQVHSTGSNAFPSFHLIYLLELVE